MDEIVKKLQDTEIKNHLREYGINHISLFGSYLQNRQTDESDVDLLYQMDYTIPYKSRWIFAVKWFLEEKLGKKCDMVNIDYMHDSIKDDILQSKMQIW